MTLLKRLTLACSVIILTVCKSYSQDPDGCALPTYNVSHNIDDGIVVFDIYQALVNDQINLAIELAPCQAWIRRK